MHLRPPCRTAAAELVSTGPFHHSHMSATNARFRDRASRNRGITTAARRANARKIAKTPIVARKPTFSGDRVSRDPQVSGKRELKCRIVREPFSRALDTPERRATSIEHRDVVAERIGTGPRAARHDVAVPPPHGLRPLRLFVFPPRAVVPRACARLRA